MRIVVLAGGIGGARFLVGVRAWLRDQPDPAGESRITAVVNIGDDVTLHGLRICPDLDSVMYTLGGGADPDRGWGRANETWVVKDELAAYGAEPSWFGLGDRDVATQLLRTRMLDDGYPLSAVTEALCVRWQPGVALLPASDDRVETHVVVDSPDADGPRPKLGPEVKVGTDPSMSTSPAGERAIHFQEWWIKHRGALDARRFVFVGAESAVPAPGVLAAIATADLVLLAPSNPVVSIAPILAIPGIREALVSGRAPVVGVSPIIAGSPVRGMADRCLRSIGVECSAAGVGGLYGSRAATGLLDAWLVDQSDVDTRVPGVRVHHTPLWMNSEAATIAMVDQAVAAAWAGNGAPDD